MDVRHLSLRKSMGVETQQSTTAVQVMMDSSRDVPHWKLLSLAMASNELRVQIPTEQMI